MKNSSLFASFEECLARNTDVVFWWRDDDVGVGGRRHIIANWIANMRLERMLALSAKYGLYSIFAVIPYRFSVRGAKQIKLLKRYGVHVALHGIRHTNKSHIGAASEFPEHGNAEADAAIILKYREEFASIFKDKLLPIFVPPWNSISENLEKILLAHGMRISTQNHTGLAYNRDCVDIDVIDWHSRKLRDEKAILQDIIALVEGGRKSIGLMGHHKVVNKQAFLFFDRLFEVISRYHSKDRERNNPWICKLEN